MDVRNRRTHREIQTHTTVIGSDYGRGGAIIVLAGILLCAAGRKERGLCK